MTAGWGSRAAYPAAYAESLKMWEKEQSHLRSAPGLQHDGPGAHGSNAHTHEDSPGLMKTVQD